MQREMLETLGGVPGVQHVTFATGTPFNGNVDGRRLSIPGVEPREPDDTIIQVNLIAPGYFDALQVPLVSGRAIDERDRENTRRVAVVSEAFARRYFGEAPAAVGRTFMHQSRTEADPARDRGRRARHPLPGSPLVPRKGSPICRGSKPMM